MRNKSTISTLLPFQGVNGFTNDNPTQGAASLALTLKVQRAKHAINDNSHSYAVEKPLNCKIPSKGVIVRSCYDSHCIK